MRGCVKKVSKMSNTVETNVNNILKNFFLNGYIYTHIHIPKTNNYYTHTKSFPASGAAKRLARATPTIAKFIAIKWSRRGGYGLRQPTEQEEEEVKNTNYTTRQ